MTIVLPENYHAFDALVQQRIKCIGTEEALHQDIRALRIGILNIMPRAERYEFNLLFPLGRSVLQIEPVWIRLNDHLYKSSDAQHIENLYNPFERVIRERGVDGLIVTGAPVEEMPFENVSYWNELRDILLYARTHIASTLGMCWGGLALAKLLGIEKVRLPKKLFGVFKARNLDRKHPITGGLDDVFFCPQSRHSGIPSEVLNERAAQGVVRLLAEGEETGPFIFESADGRFLMHLGHPEYNSSRLVEEYRRDLARGRTDIGPPANMDVENPLNCWRSHRNEFFTQWIKYVYEHNDLSK